MINLIKNKLRSNKKQVYLNEEVIKKYPNLHKTLYRKSKYKHIFASIVLIIGLTILISYNKTYKSYVSDTTSVYFIENSGRFQVNVKEDGILKKMELLPFFKNYGDSFMFVTDIKDSLINIESDWGFRASFLLSKNVDYNRVFGDAIIINYDFDSTSIAKLKNEVGDKLIILNKKYNWDEKSIYIVCKDSFSGDVPVFEYGKLFVLLKNFPYGLKFVSFDKER